MICAGNVCVCNDEGLCNDSTIARVSIQVLLSLTKNSINRKNCSGAKVVWNKFNIIFFFRYSALDFSGFCVLIDVFDVLSSKESIYYLHLIHIHV